MAKAALAAIRFYQMTMSPYLGGYCRHAPTCSHYAHDAVSQYGVVRGAWLAAKRLGRCRPLGTGGYDPVP